MIILVYDCDVIAEANNEEDIHVDAQEIIRQNSFNLRKLGNKVCTDEIDTQPKIRTIRNKIECEEQIIKECDENGDNGENNNDDNNNNEGSGDNNSSEKNDCDENEGNDN